MNQHTSKLRKLLLACGSSLRIGLTAVLTAATVAAQEPGTPETTGGDQQVTVADPKPTTADPTQISPEMQSLLESLRGGDGGRRAASSAARSAAVEEPVLAGLVADGPGEADRGVVILRLGDRFVLAREGETLAANGRTFVLDAVNSHRVEMSAPGSDRSRILYSRPLSGGDAPAGELPVFDFQDVPLALVARAISEITGVQAVPSAGVRDLSVSLHLRGAGVREMLDTLALTHNLYLNESRESGILRLHSVEEYSGKSTLLRDEQTRTFTLKYPNARDVALAIKDLYGDRVRLSRRVDEEEESGEFSEEDLQERLSRFDIFDNRGQGFGVDSDNGSNRSRSINNSRSQSNRFNRVDGNRFNRFNRNESSRDGRDVFLEREFTAEEIARLENVDTGVRDSALETLLVQTADIHVSIIDRLNLVMVRTRDQRTMAEISELVDELDIPTGLVYLEVNVLAVDLDRGVDSAFEWSYTSESGNTQFQISPGGPVSTPTLAFSALDGRFKGALNVLESKGRLTALGKPTLVTANNEVSRIFIGEEVPLNRNFNASNTIITEGTPIVQGSSSDIEFRSVGSTLLITPNINDDNTVTLRILQEESQVVRGGADILVPDGLGGFVNRKVDIIAAQTASGTFVGMDGQTIAIGGLIREDMVERRSQIPILGAIPVLGVPFRSQTSTRERREIILLMTPHIIRNPQDGEDITMPLIEKESIHPNPDGKGWLEPFNEKDVLQPENDEFGPEFYTPDTTSQPEKRSGPGLRPRP